MDRFEVVPLPGHDPTIGRWLWAMQEARQRTLRLVEDLRDDLLNWEGPDGQGNAIGSLLYHIAEAEMGWLWGCIKGRTQFPPDILKDFPFEPLDGETGRLWYVQGVPLSEHVRRLRDSREVFLREVEGLTPAQWRTPLPDQEDDGCEFSPEWILFHLARHEMEHNEQISWLKSRWASHRRTGNRT